MSDATVRRGMPDPQLSREAFRERFLGPFRDPAFASLSVELERVAEAAWQGYAAGRKSPVARRAGPGYEDPDLELADDWLAAKAAVEAARLRHDDPAAPRRVLLVNGAARSEHTCPGEMSKSWRLLQVAREVLEAAGLQIEVLDLSRLASEYGRRIHPCKTCFSTAAPLCHFPCSCYPNYALGQTQDWMNEIYPMWIAAHGVLLVTPVNWYQASSPLKLMMDRLVCADGGNPDPTRTGGKDPARAKALELRGWPYPRHLAGRLFAVVVHGDTEGADGLRRMLVDWLAAMALVPAGEVAQLGRQVGYYAPYASSHAALDADPAVQQEVRRAAAALADALSRHARGLSREPDPGVPDPRPK